MVIAIIKAIVIGSPHVKRCGIVAMGFAWGIPGRRVVLNIRVIRHKPLEVAELGNIRGSSVHEGVIVSPVDVTLFAELLDNLGLQPAIPLGSGCSVVLLFASLLVF